MQGRRVVADCEMSDLDPMPEGVICKLDVGTEFGDKGRQTTSNRGGEDGEGGGGDGLGEDRKSVV